MREDGPVIPDSVMKERLEVDDMRKGEKTATTDN